MSAPPYLESEYAHKPYAVDELTDGDHMSAFWIIGVEPHEASGHLFGFECKSEGVGYWGGCNVCWDLNEKWVAICKKVRPFEFD